MKTAAKVFLILSMIASGLGFLLLLISGIIAMSVSGAADSTGILVGASAITTIIVGFVCLIPFIVGIIAYRKLDTAMYHNQLVGIGIVTLLFCNLIAGILILVMHDSDLRGYR